ncbi:unnamed protein product [Cyprideis torosa]|uniref:Methionyl-tRNA formyltransferase, mitochondrial n=1 Tax=Cyprideis torosa TaxID=163714 RepID=A0A7R8ZV97_9CRUS|nr:unnamed protein product [Cyprideis torosa]CAG0902189.1 unnamed protein product [Cyprideis torosa]
MGTPDFALPPLQALLASDNEVLAVVTQPDRAKGRGKKLSPPAVKELALQYGIPVLQPTKIKSLDFHKELAALRPDLIVVVAYGRILPTAILDLPPLGCLNVHGSLLPRHRGAAPIQWAILQGDRETGVTIMQMAKGMDTGDILLQAKESISEEDTTGTLFTRLANLGAQTLLIALDRLRGNSLHPVKQDELLATAAPPLHKDMGEVDWSLSSQEIHCLIRGLDPWPSAYTFCHGTRYRLFRPEIVQRKSNAVPGTILLADPENGLVVATGDMALRKGGDNRKKCSQPSRSEAMNHILYAIATGLYVGRLPKAPGTWGSLAAFIPWLALKDLPLALYMAAVLFLLCLGFLVAGSMEKYLQARDPSLIVIDEIVGMLIALTLVPNHPLALLLAFAFFRLFDITKPWPIRFFDRHVHGGLGIMLDDVVAGIFALVLLQLTWQIASLIT